MPVSRYMRAPVRSVGANETLDAAGRALARHDVSSLAVTDDGRLLGVITRSDLLRVGRRGADGAVSVDLPDVAVADAMTKDVVTVARSTPLREAARSMVESRIHRVFVLDGADLVGVLSPHEILRAIVDARLPTPISEHVSRPVMTVGPDDTLAIANDALGTLSGLVVVEDDWPIGVFTQREALAARELPPETPLDGLYSAQIACMPTTTPLHRAATQAMATRVQRVLAMERRKVDGILSGIDFARAII